MIKQTISVPLPGREYDISIGSGILKTGTCSALKPFVEGRQCLILTDSNVAPLYLDSLTTILQNEGATSLTSCTFPAGEQSKTVTTVASFYSECVKAGLDRKSLIVALGGGVTGDMAGFLAATYMRGIDFIQVPTTLLSQVDSSVGGKTGVDLPEGKNLVGAFKQPLHVLIDSDTLTTLPKRELLSGLAEVVKYGVILDVDFLSYLEGHVDGLLSLDSDVYAQVIGRSCELKAQVVLDDEHDLTGLRAILNYGHTFGHALETLGGFEALTHGEGVAIGMMMAADLSAARHPELAELVSRQQRLWGTLGLPTTATGFDAQKVLECMRSDKKYENGRTRLILPVKAGTCQLVKDVPEDEILAAIKGRCEP